LLSEAELAQCAALTERLAELAVERISARPRPAQIATKGNAADWVTDTDRGVEQLVLDAILAEFPNHRVSGEELGVTGDDDDAPATWLVDPIDGTTNYVHGLPLSSFSACVADEGGAAAAVVADPYRGEVLSAIRGQGARRDGTPVTCSAATSLMGGIVLTEFSAQSVWDGMFELMRVLAGAGCVTRILGSNALSVASVATGRALATVIGQFNVGDCLGAALIAEEAGARVLWASGMPRQGDLFVAAAPGVLEELLAVWPGARRVTG
jgi:fructose-1,6-bisphosphatase/inositol monophosphatase family enzyme